jgi:hypothetical protein
MHMQSRVTVVADRDIAEGAQDLALLVDLDLLAGLLRESNQPTPPKSHAAARTPAEWRRPPVHPPERRPARPMADANIYLSPCRFREGCPSSRPWHKMLGGSKSFLGNGCALDTHG